MSQSRSPDDFHGVWTALVTPFRADFSIDWDAFEKILKQQEDGGVHGVVISGTTGENPTLSVQEKLSLIRKARAILGPGVRLMAGSGDSNTQQSVELSRLAQDAGADSLLVVTPPYNKPSTAGLTLHFKAITQAVKIPVCLYHVPSRTGQMLTLDQMQTVCQAAGIKAVKEASADVAYFSRAQLRTGIPFLSGDDPTCLASMAVGGKGVVSVVSNVFPKAMVSMYKSAAAGDRQNALALHNALMPALDVLALEVNPCPVKAAMQVLGLCKNVLRPPMAEVSAQNYLRVQEVISSTADTLKRLS